MAINPYLARSLSQGITSPRQHAQNRRDQQQQNELAKLLVQQQQMSNRGTQLGNTQKALELKKMLQPKQPTLGEIRQIGENQWGRDVIGPNGQIMETRPMGPGYQPSYQKPEKPKAPSALQEKISIIGGKPFAEMTTEEKQAAYAKVPKSGQTINLGGKDGNELDQYNTSMIGGLGDAAMGAGNRAQQAEQGLGLLKSMIQSGNETGKWANMRNEASAWLGVDPENVADAQLFGVKMGDKVMGRIQQTKGAVSEKEMAYFDKISPGINKEPFTNYVLLEIDRRSAMREEDKMNYIVEFKTGPGKGNMMGFDKWYLKNHDPFPPFDLDQLRGEFEGWSGAGDTVESQPQLQLPKAGQEQDGYRFIGGDPADPNSWKQI